MEIHSLSKINLFFTFNINNIKKPTLEFTNVGFLLSFVFYLEPSPSLFNAEKIARTDALVMLLDTPTPYVTWPLLESNKWMYAAA